MAKIWLPIKHIVVEYGGRSCSILLPMPKDVDLGQMREVEAWQREKTLKELQALPPRVPKHSKEEVAAALNEYLKYQRKKHGKV